MLYIFAFNSLLDLCFIYAKMLPPTTINSKCGRWRTNQTIERVGARKIGRCGIVFGRCSKKFERW